MFAIAVLLSCCLATTRAAVYPNSYDGPLDFKCPSHQFISYFWSHHDNHYEDRVFQLQCSPAAANFNEQPETCFWSAYVNTYDDPFAYNCPTNHYIAGIHSEHNNHNEDRIFKFYCCSIPTHHETDCEFSGFQNHYDQDVSYTVPAGNVLKGMVSVHENREEDRIFDFEVCKLEAINTEPVG